MKIRLNEDAEIVKTVKEGLKARGGYCPCRFEKTEDNKCMCKEFRDQIADPNFEGYCHCMLYYKDIKTTPVCFCTNRPESFHIRGKPASPDTM